MNCDIVIRSYYKDFAWLGYCLKSIEKYCYGFRNVIVVVPNASKPWLRRVDLGCSRVLTCQNYADDYLGQQVTKLFADTFTDADYICHLDSDCVFDRTTTPDDLFDNGKVQVVMIPYHNLPRDIPWQSITARCLKRDIAYEFMVRQPITFPRWLYRELRTHIQGLHGVDIETYVISQLPRDFSEFNALGAYAYHYHREKFSWLHVSTVTSVKRFCRWYWSWGGIEPEIKREIQKILD